jgi:hypothetical protein
MVFLALPGANRQQVRGLEFQGTAETFRGTGLADAVREDQVVVRGS